MKIRGYVVQVVLITSFGKVVTLTVKVMTQIIQKCQAILGNVTFPLKNARNSDYEPCERPDECVTGEYCVR